MVERAAPGGEGDVIDHFNAAALKHYLSKFDSVFKAIKALIHQENEPRKKIGYKISKKK